ncbi:MAG: hypothetical protein H8E38_12600 [SAR324 cluster bacterium]|nr:hypothetical protein [SAR324 cluster bacterium]MBL7034855.1 hypothetical protein [SAR324 cluster bacterium]
MKDKKKLLKTLHLILTVLLLTGCGWFGENTEPLNESYEAGKKALSEGQYDVAKSHFRQITPNSPFYPQAVWMLQKVPFKKGVASYEQKKYQIAISELSKVPVHSPDYVETQRYIKLANYAMLNDQYTKSSAKERIVLLREMFAIANELEDSSLVLANVNLIEEGLKQADSAGKTRDLLNLLSEVLSVNKEPELQQKALNYLLTDFEKLYGQPELRPDVFRMIGNIKMELM